MKDSSIARRFNMAFNYQSKYKLISTLLRLMDKVPECDKVEIREFCAGLLANGNGEFKKQDYANDRQRLRKIIV